MDTQHAIAVVGMACRFPGANDIDEFWKVLVNGENHVSEIPKERWNNDAFYSGGKPQPGKSYVKHAAFIDGFNEWDNKFFNINDDEADRMDPQQALLLECTYRALENGGFTHDMINGKNIGCYIGAMNDDHYKTLVDLDQRNNYTVTGVSRTILANRLSYAMNLTGPSISIDTACSSALVAIHLACQAIDSGDCGMAVAGGVNIISEPGNFVSLCQSRMLSPTGQCRPFSSEADGFTRGEGCGIVVLKSLDRAIADHDRIYALIGTGTNQDGHFVSPISAPSARQQEELMRKVYAKYNVDPADISFIEAHGAGTKIGDPIEATALGKAIGHAPNRHNRPCYMGSVKGNIAHPESAAGVAGLIKVLLMLKNKKIVPSLHNRKVNENINLEKFSLQLPYSVMEWPTESGKPRLACVNSFGFGGSNGHVVVMEYIEQKPETSNMKPQLPVVALSAKSKTALSLTIQNLQKVLKQNTDQYLEDLAYTSTVRRSHYNYRIAIPCTDNSNLATALSRANGTLAQKKPSNSQLKKRVIFTCSGMGTDWQGMGIDLLEHEPVFLETLQKIDHFLSRYTKLSVIHALKDEETREGIMKPIATFAIQLGLHHLLVSWGVRPDAVVGHSVGEVAAAVIAGKLPLEIGVKIIYHRSRLLENVSGDGKMIAIENISMEQVQEYCQRANHTVEIAAMNSKNSFTLSGDANAIMGIDEWVKTNNDLDGSEMVSNILKVKTAFHSHHTEGICEELKTLLIPLDQIDDTATDTTELYSTVTGSKVMKSDVTDESYWQRNVRQVVRFHSALTASLRSDVMNVIIEIGPKPVLQRYIKTNAQDVHHEVFPTMKAGSGRPSIIDTLCRLYENGVTIDWRAYYKYSDRVPGNLPMLHFNKRKCWFETETAYRLRMGMRFTDMSRFLLTTRLTEEGSLHKFNINRRDFPYLYDHVVGGSVIMPGAVYVELVLESLYSTQPSVAGRDTYKLSIEFLTFLQIIDMKDIEVTLNETGVHGKYKFSVSCNKTLHATGVVSTESSILVPKAIEIYEIKNRCIQEVDSEELYNNFTSFGLQYGKLMRPIVKAWKNNHEIFAILRMPDEVKDQLQNTILHPILIDGMLQTAGLQQFSKGPNDKKKQQCFLSSIGNIMLYGRPESQVCVYSRLIHQTESLLNYNMLMMNLSGEVVAECTNAMAKCLNDDVGTVVSKLAYEPYWYADQYVQSTLTKESSTQTISRQTCIVFADNMDVANRIKSMVKQESLFLHPTSSTATLTDIASVMASYTQPYDHVLYFWGIKDIRNESCPYDHILSICRSLRDIIKYLSKNNAKCPLTVVTLGTQVIPEMQDWKACESPKYADCGLVGCALWGMVRSLLYESTYNNTRLIDLHSISLQVLNTAWQILFHEKMNEHMELFIKDATVYTNRLRRIKHDKHHFKKRLNHAQQGHPVQLMSSHPLSLNNLVAMYVPEDNVSTNGCHTVNTKQKDHANSKDSHMVNIKVDMARLHQHEIFPVTKEGYTARGSILWPEDNGTGYSVFTLDCVGEVVSSDAKIKQGTLVQSCYPIVLQSEIRVPNAAIIECSKLPQCLSKIPCLSLVILLWEIIVKNANLYPAKEMIVQGDQRYSLLCDFLLRFAKVDYKPKACMTEQCGYKEPTAVTFVYCGDIHQHTEKSVIENLPVGSTMMNIVENNTDTTANIIMSRPDIHIVTIKTRDVFQPRYLTENIPKAVKWLKSIPPKLYSDIVRITHYKAHLGCMMANTAFEDGSIVILKMNQFGLVEADDSHLFHPNACYLVVGGTKGLGLEVVKYLSSHGAGHIAVLSRNPPNSSSSSELSDVIRSGVKIIFLQGDVSNVSELAKALTELREKLDGIPIRGVFHGAVVLADHLLINMTDQQFITPMAPKILGAWNLHQLTINDQLDYFVMHSSVTSVFGNRGQTNYGAANAFLDYFAHFRRAKGLPGQVINWSVLSIGVMENATEVMRRFTSLGYMPLDKLDIIKCLDYAIKHNPTQILFGKFQWSTLLQVLQSGSTTQVQSKFNDFMGTVENRCKEDEEVAKATAKNTTVIHDIIRTDAARVLTLEKEEVFDDSTLVGLGLDSTQAITLQAHIKHNTGVEVPIIHLLDQTSTVSNITNYIQDQKGEAIPTLPKVAEGSVVESEVTETLAMRY